jgi:hypothetical protein
MARCTSRSYNQDTFIPVSFGKQILSGTFERALRYLVDREQGLLILRNRYRRIQDIPFRWLTVISRKIKSIEEVRANE